MINLTNNQVEAFNRLMDGNSLLYRKYDDKIKIHSGMNFNVIKIVLDCPYTDRFYYIRKNRIDVVVYRKTLTYKKYTYKLKKR